jgi:hypothetical protein
MTAYHACRAGKGGEVMSRILVRPSVTPLTWKDQERGRPDNARHA